MKLNETIEKGNRNFICECCGTQYEEMPLCFGSEYPDFYFSVPPEERTERIEMEKSLCVVDKKSFFHRGRLEIPIIGRNENLMFDVWLSISRDNFGIRMDDWDNPNRINNTPYFGWLQNQIPTYEYSINIKAKALGEEIGAIPRIIVTDEDHQLSQDQKHGIPFKKAAEIVQFVLNRQHKK